MKKLFLLFSIVILSGCGMLDRGNYNKDRSGYVLNDKLIVSYHTNSIGEIDVFQIDQVMSFFEALEYTDFDMSTLSTHSTISSYVTVAELDSCGVESNIAVPRFIRIENRTYFYNVRDNGYCTFDEYEFYTDGYTDLLTYDVEEISPLGVTNTTLFRDIDFMVNTFEIVIFIENIYYDDNFDIWIKEIVTPLPMSLKQAGSLYEDTVSFVEEVSVLEKYVLNNQSINLLELKENYTDEDINNIWSDSTVEVLGRDHEVIKNVRLDQTQDILDIIQDTLGRLGMFQ